MKKITEVIVLLFVVGSLIGIDVESTELKKSKSNDEKINQQIERLKSGDVKEQLGAVRVLEEIANKAAITALIKALRDENKKVRHSSAQALAKIGKPAVPFLLKALEEERSNVGWGNFDRMYAIHGITFALGKIGDKSAIPPLFELVKNDIDPNVKLYAAEALCMMEDESIIYDLLKMGMEESMDVDLESHLKGEEGKDVTTAMSIPMAIFNMRELVRPTLIKALENEDWKVRCYAIAQFYQSDFYCAYDKSIIYSLIGRLKDENAQVCHMALGLLERITNKDFGEDEKSWYGWLQSVIAGKGTIEYSDLEGGFYDIMADDGKRYSPIEISQRFQIDGLQVHFLAEIPKDIITIPRRGTPIEIIKIKKSK